MFVLNTTKVGGKQYSMQDLKEGHLYYPSMFDLPQSWYGGRVHRIGATKDGSGLLLMVNQTNGFEVIDLGVQDPREINQRILRELVLKKNPDMKLSVAVSKDELLGHLGVPINDTESE